MVTSIPVWRRSLYVTVLCVLALTLAALACGPTTTGGQATSAPVATKASTEAPSGTTSGGGTSGGGSTTTAEASTPEAGAPGGGGGAIDAGNVTDLVELRTISVSAQALTAGVVSPANHDVATFGADRTVRLWDADTGKKLRELPRPADLGFGLAFSNDGKILASGAGFIVTLWDPDTGKQIRSATASANVYRMAFSPDGKTLAVAGQYHSKLDSVDVATGQVTTGVASPSGYDIWAVAYSHDGTMLATADSKGNVTVFDASSGSVLGTASTPRTAWDIEFSPDGKYVTTCNSTNSVGGISTWDTSDFSVYENLTLPDVHPKGCRDGSYSKNGDVFFSVGADGVINAWEVSSGNLLFSKDIGAFVWTVSVSGDGSIIALALDDGTVHILGLK